MKRAMTRRLYLKLALAGAAAIASGCASTGGTTAQGRGAGRAGTRQRLLAAHQRAAAMAVLGRGRLPHREHGRLCADPQRGIPRLLDRLGRAQRLERRRSDDKAAWKYSYGETPEHVLFGDWQVCFQTYADLYELDGRKDARRIARAREVMEYQMGTAERSDYWWWADGLYMVMPVMTKLYKATGERRYLDKLQEYFIYADQLMFDQDSACTTATPSTSTRSTGRPTAARTSGRAATAGCSPAWPRCWPTCRATIRCARC
jgi:unsaturated rhamnogalacturonyl hydrolase